MGKLQSIEKKGLVLLVEVRQDLQAKRCYVVTSSLGRVRFRSLESVLDFMNMNDNLGYVE